MRRTMVVATDGSPASLGALRLGIRLKEHHDTDLEILGIVEPIPVFDAGFLVAVPEVELYESRQEALRLDIMDRIEEAGGEAQGERVRVEAGLPAPRIVRRAEEIGASLIVMGLGRHRPMDRIFGAETALQVVRLSRIPVLAVPHTSSTLPTSAALGVDFSGFSQRGAQAALEVLRDPWEIHLVHVMSGMEFLPTVSEEWRTDYEGELQERLSEVARKLPASGGSKVHTQVLEGEPAHELLAFVKSRGVELLVAGSHGLSFVGRLLMGSVSTRIIRGARVPVLVIPPLDLAPEVERAGPGSGTLHPWVRELQEFTAANAGCRTTLELDDPEVGAQECGRDFPLWGVDYDPRSGRVDIMLGRSGTVEGHLTHSLPNPQSVEVIRGEEGRDQGLRIRFPRGQILLRIHRD